MHIKDPCLHINFTCPGVTSENRKDYLNILYIHLLDIPHIILN